MSPDDSPKAALEWQWPTLHSLSEASPLLLCARPARQARQSHRPFPRLDPPLSSLLRQHHPLSLCTPAALKTKQCASGGSSAQPTAGPCRPLGTGRSLQTHPHSSCSSCSSSTGRGPSARAQQRRRGATMATQRRSLEVLHLADMEHRGPPTACTTPTTTQQGSMRVGSVWPKRLVSRRSYECCAHRTRDFANAHDHGAVRTRF